MLGLRGAKRNPRGGAGGVGGIVSSTSNPRGAYPSLESSPLEPVGVGISSVLGVPGSLASRLSSGVMSAQNLNRPNGRRETVGPLPSSTPTICILLGVVNLTNKARLSWNSCAKFLWKSSFAPWVPCHETSCLAEVAG